MMFVTASQLLPFKFPRHLKFPRILKFMVRCGQPAADAADDELEGREKIQTKMASIPVT